MLTSQPVFRCGATGCKSHTMLSAADSATPAASRESLVKRGWEVAAPEAAGGTVPAERHFCPGCANKPTPAE